MIHAMIICMKTVGIIAEFNPFHNGHKYLFEQARIKTGADHVVVVMSGSFVQRGEPAVTCRTDRALAALKCGADLVLELPVSYATASAEAFAYGGISILNSLGAVDHVCFGTESDDVDGFREIALTLVNPTPEYDSMLRQGLKSGLSYPAARAAALPEHASLLDGSNNVLAIEYIKAMIRLDSRMDPVAIPRIGMNYNDEAISEHASAAGIRAAISQNLDSPDSLRDVLGVCVPADCHESLMNSIGRTCPVTLSDMLPYLDHAMLTMNVDQISRLQDLNPDLADRMTNAYYGSCGNDAADYLKSMRTKELTYSRLSRAMLHVMLNLRDLTRDDEGILLPCPYARILGFKKEARALMHELKSRSSIPLISKPADSGRNLTDERSLELFEATIRADRLYDAMITRKFGFRPADTMRVSPIIT